MNQQPTKKAVSVFVFMAFGINGAPSNQHGTTLTRDPSRREVWSDTRQPSPLTDYTEEGQQIGLWALWKITFDSHTYYPPVTIYFDYEGPLPNDKERHRLGSDVVWEVYNRLFIEEIEKEEG